MISEPRIETRPAQPYAGKRVVTPMSDLGTVIPQSHGEVMRWMRERGLAPAGAPFIRYHVIDMAGHMDVELGWPLAAPVTGEGAITGGELPAGRYAVLLYTGPYDGLMAANGALIDWAAAQGLAWDRWDDPHGDAFGSRYETYFTDPADEPDPAKWQTEVAIRLAE